MESTHLGDGRNLWSRVATQVPLATLTTDVMSRETAKMINIATKCPRALGWPRAEPSCKKPHVPTNHVRGSPDRN